MTEGLVRHATYTEWEAVPLAGLLEDRLGMAVVVDNDVNALVAAEQWFGPGAAIADFVAVSLGRGIGLGLVLDGRLYRGRRRRGRRARPHQGGAPTARSAPAATAGCLEAFASEPAIAAAVSAPSRAPS